VLSGNTKNGRKEGHGRKAGEEGWVWEIAYFLMNFSWGGTIRISVRAMTLLGKDENERMAREKTSSGGKGNRRSGLMGKNLWAKSWFKLGRLLRKEVPSVERRLTGCEEGGPIGGQK